MTTPTMPTMPTAIFIGTQHALHPVFHEASARLQVVHKAQWEAGLQAIASEAPQLIVISGTADQSAAGDFVQRLRERLPGCRVPLVVVGSATKNEQLTVYIWDALKREYTPRWRAVDDLLEVIEALVQPAAPHPELAKLKDAGHYNLVGTGQEARHVQTEVLWLETIRIKTTVIEQGRILHVTAQSLPMYVDDVAQGEAYVREQHDGVLAAVDSGGLDKLEHRE
jgi:DNA-binding response OmpR family regulator